MTSEHAVPERLVPGTLAWELYEIEHRQRYEFFAPRCRGFKVLDAACGVGYGSDILHKHGASCVTGIDLAPDAVRYANEHFESAAFFVRGNVEHLPFETNAFDTVISFETLEHVPHPAFFLDEVKRVLKPNGLFVCSTPNKEFVPFSGDKPQNPFHESEMTLTEFCTLVGQRFEITEQYYQSHSPSFVRYIELLRYIETLNKPLRYSKLLRMENALRQLLRQEVWQEPKALPTRLGRALPGDFTISPLTKSSTYHLTFILVAILRI